MDKIRLDEALVLNGLVISRSQAASLIKLGKVKYQGQVIEKPGYFIKQSNIPSVHLLIDQQYVNRAALKLASVKNTLNLDFKDKVVLDIGSSTGGFSEYSLNSGASSVIAVEKGSNQLHPKLKDDPKIELHEKTDILDFKTDIPIDIALLDLSFVSLRQILPHIKHLFNPSTLIVAMVKPQFEAKNSGLKHKGVIKNEKMRRDILKQFEDWVKSDYKIISKQDSAVSGSKGNLERFYVLKVVK